jgi:hypothetical protein
MEITPTRLAGLFLFVLVAGIALGIVGTILVSRLAGPDLLSPFEAGGPVEGRVLDKAPEPDRLLLKVETEDGVFLATFTERQTEIDLLVDPGDTITLDAREYQPFLEDPAIERVRKPKPPTDTDVEEEPQIAEPEATEPTAEPQETETTA